MNLTIITNGQKCIFMEEVLFRFTGSLVFLSGPVRSYRGGNICLYCMSRDSVSTSLDALPVSQKKQDTLLFPITLPNVNWFSKFFHKQTQQ